MKRCTCLYLMLLVIVTGCSKEANPADKLTPASEAGRRSVPEQKPAGAVRRSDMFLLSPSIRDGAALYAGWPLILDLTVWRQLPEDGASPVPQPITLKTKSGSWGETLAVTIKDSAGHTVQLPLHLVTQEGDVLSLGVDDVAEATWWLSPEETKGLAEGVFAISVAFNPKLLRDNLVQKVDNYYLRVKKEPSPLDSKTREDKDRALASFAILRGDLSAASDRVDKMLASDQESIDGYRLKARLLDAAGKTEEAVASLETALDIIDKKFPNADPSWVLIAERDALTAKLKRNP